MLFCILGCAAENIDTPLDPDQEETSNNAFKKVLMIGNSHTYYNDLPDMVEEIMNEMQDSVVVNSLTVGGYNLENHVSANNTTDQIGQEKWDYVVLQESGPRAASEVDEAMSFVYPNAAQLIKDIRTNHDQTKVILYLPHAYNGDEEFCDEYPQYCDFDNMLDKMRRNYIFMSNRNEVDVAPAGVVWKYLFNNISFLELHDADMIHPNYMGSFVSASVIASILMDRELDSDKINFERVGAEIQSEYYDAINLMLWENDPDWKTY